MLSFLAPLLMITQLQIGNICQWLDRRNDSNGAELKVAVSEGSLPSTMARQWRQILSLLMPNMAKLDDGKAVKEDSEPSSTLKHTQDASEEHSSADQLSSIELFTDIESLLRKLNGQLQPIDEREGAKSASSSDKVRCWEQSSLLFCLLPGLTLSCD